MQAAIFALVSATLPFPQSAVSGQTFYADAGVSSSRATDVPEAKLTTGGRPDVTVPVRPFSALGLAFSVGTGGLGGQVATPLSRRTSLRAGASFFSYDSATYTNDGIDYNGTLKLRSAEALLDWFPWGGSFRLSPGVQLYNGLNATGKLAVPAGQSFRLNGVSYVSSTVDPVTGDGRLTTRAAAPMFTLGWGNLVSRRGHWSVPIELGFVYQGVPRVSLALAGSACDSTGAFCRGISSDPTIQSNVAAQQKIVSDDAARYFRFYPVVSIGIGYKF